MILRLDYSKLHLSEMYNNFFGDDISIESKEMTKAFSDIVGLQNSGVTDFDELHYALEDEFIDEDTLSGEFLHTFLLNQIETLVLELNVDKIELMLDKDVLLINTEGSVLRV